MQRTLTTRSDKTMKTKLEELNNYTGPSMNPTFKAGDGLVVVPYKDKKIRPGDVITFKSKDRSHNVVHRVIRVGRHGVCIGVCI